jgi:hypothetical protein
MAVLARNRLSGSDADPADIHDFIAWHNVDAAKRYIETCLRQIPFIVQ